MNPKEIAEASRIAESVRSALQEAIGRFIDALDENGSDAVNRPKVLGYLVGVNAFVGSFRGLEGALVSVLAEAGISRANYERMVHAANVLGEAEAQVLFREFR